MDVDNSVATGYSMKGIGVDYGCEGNVYAEWFAQVLLIWSMATRVGLSWDLKMKKLLKPGYITKDR